MAAHDLARLHYYILLLHLKTERDELRRQVAQLSSQPKTDGLAMTPKISGVPGRLDKLKHNLDARADRFYARADATEEHAAQSFGAAEATLDAANAALAEIDTFSEQMKGDNNSPSFDGAADSASRPTQDGSGEPSAAA